MRWPSTEPLGATGGACRAFTTSSTVSSRCGSALYASLPSARKAANLMSNREKGGRGLSLIGWLAVVATMLTGCSSAGARKVATGASAACAPVAGALETGTQDTAPLPPGGRGEDGTTTWPTGSTAQL